ncbi:MAG: ParA family protein, partial [Nitrospirota bacterium]|nr:ParA family protein [Nitrospirota bacterium]
MRTLVLANQKGGVGKSAIACQLGYFLSEVRKKRVLLIDLDHQGNSTKNIRSSTLAVVSSTTSSRLLTDSITSLEDGRFILIPSDADLLKLERQADRHNLFATHLQAFLKAVDDRFDVAIIDTNPNPDIRVIAALVVSDFVLSPIQLNQEAVDGIVGLKTQVSRIQGTLNPSLTLLGLLPNLVDPTPFQRANMVQLCTLFASSMIRLGNGHMAAISSRTAMAEAQALGKPIWKLGKTSSREAWTQMKPIFEHV